MVASTHIVATLYIASIIDRDNGKRNKAKPVSLFNVLCMDSSSFLRIKTNALFNILISAIMMIQAHSHIGICMAIGKAHHISTTDKLLFEFVLIISIAYIKEYGTE